MTQLSTLYEGISSLVRERGYVSFVEILRLFPDEKGDLEMCFPNNPNIVLWGGVSEELANTLIQLLNDEVIHFHPASELTYLADGSIPQLPLAKGLHQYKTRHWFPVCFHHSPYEPGK